MDYQHLAQLDQQRDDSESETFKLPEKVELLEINLAERSKQIEHINERLKAANELHTTQKQQLQEKDKEIFSLRKQNERLNMDRKQLQHDKELISQQLSSCIADQTHLTKENQVQDFALTLLSCSY